MKKKRLIRSFDLLKRYKKNLMMMKCCIVFVFLFSLNLSANVYSQKNMVSLDLSDVSRGTVREGGKTTDGTAFHV